MSETEQGVLRQSKLPGLLIWLLLLSTFCLSYNVSADTADTDSSAHEDVAQKHHAYIIYSPDNALHSNIVKKLSKDLRLRHPDITISELTPQEKAEVAEPAKNIIISIGHAGMQSANEHYPNIKKIFITTDPNRYRLQENEDNAALYMTQSYCRQMKFIRLLNTHWETISILSSQKKPVDSAPLQQCAKKYNFQIYIVHTSAKRNQTNKIKQALSHSDVLLALPDSSIYNSRTVKNILLTSYRYRKPVIAFSRNFVNAGALASIYSNTEQIAQSASKIIEQYFNSDAQFKKPVNFPETFDISINRQVFRALDLDIPDINELKQSLQDKEHDKVEASP